MHDLSSAIHAAWRRIRPHLEQDDHALAARLQRRRTPTLMRPPRAWCLALRASDRRLSSSIHHSSFSIQHSEPIHLTASLLKSLCAPVHIDSPGQTLDEVALKLGTTPVGLRNARIKNIFRVRHIKGLAGRRGRPVPLLYTDQPLDPAARGFALPDPIWSWTARWLLDRLPPDFHQTLTRIPHYREHTPRHLYDEHRHPEIDPVARKAPSRRLPPPEPDYVWYKWSRSGHFLGTDPTNWRKSFQDLGERPPRNLARRSNRKSKIANPKSSSGSLHFNGHFWLCPICNKQCRTIYLPLPRINLLDSSFNIHHSSFPSLPRLAQIIDIPRKREGFACRRCHRVRFFSRVSKDVWNDLVAYLTGGLLYGHEVPRPSSFTRDRKNAYAPRPSREPSRRRRQVTELLLQGFSYAAIAQRLGIAMSRVNKYTKEAYAQHNVHGRAALARKLNLPAPAAWTIKRAQVRHHLAAGLTAHEIAARLGLTKKAVEHHIAYHVRAAKVKDRHALAEHLGWPVHRYRKPSPQRDTIRHLLKTGLTLHQIAEKIGTTPATVRAQIWVLRQRESEQHVRAPACARKV